MEDMKMKDNETKTLKFKARVNFFPNIHSIPLFMFECLILVLLVTRLNDAILDHNLLLISITVLYSLYLLYYILIIFIPFTARFKIENGIMFFSIYDRWFKGKTIEVDKYKIYNNRQNNDSIDLVLEIWFGKLLLTVREKIDNNSYSDLRTFRCTNLGYTIRTVAPGTIDKIEAFINESGSCENP